MLETFDTATNWANVAQCDTPTLETTTVLQGAGALSVTKSGTGATTGTVMKKLAAPIDLASWRARQPNALLEWSVRHANFTNVVSISISAVYRFDSSGAVDRAETWTVLKAALSNGVWNTVSIALNAPTSTTGAVGDEHRSKVIAWVITIVMSAAANTISAVLFDALEIRPTQPPGAIYFNNETISVPAFQPWMPDLLPDLRVNHAPQRSHTMFLGRYATIAFGLLQARAVHRPDSHVHTGEENLRRFIQYVMANQGWGVAWPARETINTTLNGAVAVGANSIVVSSAIGFAFLGLTATLEAGYVDLRLGPSGARRYEWCRAIGISGTTVYLDRPLAHAFETGKAVRSAGFYPSLALMDGKNPLTPTGKAVQFQVYARETA